MISFIIIGRNEGWKLTKCVESVFTTIDSNELRRYEVIYVDSNSQDDSIQRAKEYPAVKIYKITGKSNAAIGRNIGAKESSGQVLFFIDGDMQITADFLKNVYDDRKGLKYNFVSGDFLNKYYDHKGNFINEKKYFKNTKILIQQTVGGLFLIKKEYWDSVNGMRNIFKRSQDIDFALRLAKQNIYLNRLPQLAAFHYTFKYRDHRRQWGMIFNGNELFARSLLYRKNLMSFYTVKRMITCDYGMLCLLTCSIFALVLGNFILFIPYFIIIIFRSFKRKQQSFISLFDNIFYYIVRDITTLLGMLFFFPKKPDNVLYEAVN